jgi:hypothetical protein
VAYHLQCFVLVSWQLESKLPATVRSGRSSSLSDEKPLPRKGKDWLARLTDGVIVVRSPRPSSPAGCSFAAHPSYAA